MNQDTPKPESPSTRRQIGRFRISTELIHDEFHAVAEVLSGMVITRAEMRYDTDSIHYTALSDKFPASDGFCEPPEFTIQFYRSESGEVTHEWKKE